MSLLLKIVVFIVFLVFLSGFYIGSFLFSRRIQRLLSEGRLFLLGQVMLLASVFSLFSFVWLLSGFFSWRLTLFFVLAAEVGGVVTGVLWRFMGSTDLPWAASSTWTGAEIAIRHPWLPQILGIVSALVLLAYPIACGFEFFSHEVPSPDVTVAIFRFTLIALFLPGLLITLPTIVSMLSSRNLDEGTRLRVLLAQGGGLFSNALVIALVLWSFGIVSKGYNFDLGGIPLTASPMLGLVVFVYFAATFLLPFYMGTAQAKKSRRAISPTTPSPSRGKTSPGKATPGTSSRETPRRSTSRLPPSSTRSYDNSAWISPTRRTRFVRPTKWSASARSSMRSIPERRSRRWLSPYGRPITDPETSSLASRTWTS